MIRLGSLAGYPFEGPRVLAGFTAPAIPAVYAILYLPDPARQQYAVTYVGHSDDLSQEPLPFRHPRASCWIERAGSRWKVFIATYEVPGGLASHRELIVRELCAVYHPSCNEQQFDQAWEDHWIGSYDAPTTAPLSTGRQPGESRHVDSVVPPVDSVVPPVDSGDLPVDSGDPPVETGGRSPD